MHEIYEKSALEPGTSWVCVAFLVGLLGWIVLAAMIRSLRRDRMAAAAEASVGEHPPPLVEGADVVLCGVVRHADDDVAVKVNVTQDGSESESSGAWSHRWTEIDREIVVAPFMLDMANGESVLVRPPKNPEVVDDLDQKVWINRNKRVLSAELVPGEKIWVRGQLERSDRADPAHAYRDVKWGWALQASGGKMLLSSEPLGAGFRTRARIHRHGAYRTSVVLAVCLFTLLPFFFRGAGHTEHAFVESTRTWITTDEDNDEISHYGVRFSNAVIGDQDEEVIGADFTGVEKGDEVAVRVSSESNWQLGPSASIHWWHALMIYFATVGIAVWYAGARRVSRPWHRRKVEHGDMGRLPDPP